MRKHLPLVCGFLFGAALALSAFAAFGCQQLGFPDQFKAGFYYDSTPKPSSK